MLNRNYDPVIDLNSEEFKQKETPIKFVIRKKQRGPVRYQEEPGIGMILDMYYPTGFMDEVTNSSNDYVDKRRVLGPNIQIWNQKHMSAPLIPQ